MRATFPPGPADVVVPPITAFDDYNPMNIEDWAPDLISRNIPGYDDVLNGGFIKPANNLRPLGRMP